jgi:DNA-binding NarL/FixJ family response regulator
MAHDIFIVDDHPVMRRGYAYLVDAEMDLSVCGESGNAIKALEQIPETEPDLVIADLSLGGMSGLELIKRIQSNWPDLPVLVVSMHDESLYADRALQAGARGYIMKSEAEAEVVKAIRRLLDGGVFLSEDLSNKILLQYAGVSVDADETPIDQLSDRELEVFEYMGRGFTTREIAEKLVLSPKTIDSYRARVKEKLAIDTNTELIRQAVVWVENQDKAP